MHKFYYSLTLIILLFLSSPHLILACSSCFFGSPKDQANIALKAGVLTLLVILLSVLGSFIALFYNIRKKAKLMI